MNNLTRSVILRTNKLALLVKACIPSFCISFHFFYELIYFVSLILSLSSLLQPFSLYKKPWAGNVSCIQTKLLASKYFPSGLSPTFTLVCVIFTPIVLII
ncbi:unnamed protein product [Brugia timori]|uniref:Uncharacterized protein n=1 Tax=Brugia timori TaxID=42155 RepID=A0A3P7SWN5_9BILA|nr:unnamed protein product [Brugia timori]